MHVYMYTPRVHDSFICHALFFFWHAIKKTKRIQSLKILFNSLPSPDAKQESQITFVMNGSRRSKS